MKRELLDNGNIWQKNDGRWIGLVRYKDEFGVTQRKSFSIKKKKTLQAKITEYVKNFNEQVASSDESKKPLKESMKNWLRVYKYTEVERTTYDRYECTAEHQIYPYIGNKPVGDITSADIKKLLTKHMNAGYAFTTSKKAYSLLKMFFKQLYQEGAIPNNPMALIDMTKKDNYLAAQNKESKPQCDMVVVFTDEELELIREEAFKRFANGKPVYQQSAAYFLMLNTGLRAGELCGIINSDIDLENRVIHLQRGVKEVHVRDGLYYVGKLEVKVGKLKSKTSKLDSKERAKIREKKLAHGQKEGADGYGTDDEVYDSQTVEGILTMLDYFISLGDQESEQDNEEQNTQTADEFNFDNAYAEYLNDGDDGYDDDLDDEDEDEYFGLSM